MMTEAEGQRDAGSGPALEVPAQRGAPELESMVPAGAMPVGIGVDVVQISAFAEQLAAPGTRFASAFTAGERRTAARRADTTGDPAQHLAARWAVKEALLKAWASSRFAHPDVIPADEVDLQEIEVVNDALGRPAVRLHGRVGQALAGHRVLASLSHDPAGDVATAFVVLHPLEGLTSEPGVEPGSEPSHHHLRSEDER